MEKKREGIRSVFRGLCLMLAVAACLGFGTVKTEAASAKTKAMKAYRAFLSKKSITWDKGYKVSTKDCKFAIVYVDNDKVPELVVYATTVPHVAGFGRLYTYRKGKVSRVGAIDLDDKKFHYYHKKGIYVSRYAMGGVFDGYFKLSKGKGALKLQKNKYIYANYTETTYSNAKRKTLSRSQFNRELKKLVGGKKQSSAKFYKNTEKNRKKYCK